MFQITHRQSDNFIRLCLAIVSGIVGAFLTYHFSPVVGIAYFCFLITWFGT